MPMTTPTLSRNLLEAAELFDAPKAAGLFTALLWRDVARFTEKNPHLPTSVWSPGAILTQAPDWSLLYGVDFVGSGLRIAYEWSRM